MNALKKIKQIGWIYSIAILFNRIVPERVCRMRRFVVYRMFVADVSSKQSIGSDADASITIEQCDTEDEIAAVEQLTYFYRKYTTGNSIAYAAKVEDQLAAGMWAATESFDENELGVRIQLNKNQAWLCAALVPKEFRRRGLYSKLLNFTITDMAKNGYVDQLVSVNPNNLGSNRIHQRMSQDTIGHVFAIRIWKTTCCWTWGKISKEKTVSWNSTTTPIGIQCEASQAGSR